METIPTPRCDANESITCKSGDPCIAPGFARQLERELTIAKQALEEIVIEVDNLNSDRAVSALCIAETALNTLSA